MKTLALLLALSTAAAEQVNNWPSCTTGEPETIVWSQSRVVGFCDSHHCRSYPPSIDLQPTDTSKLPLVVGDIARQTAEAWASGWLTPGFTLQNSYNAAQPAPASLYHLQDADSCPFTNGCACDLDCPIGQLDVNDGRYIGDKVIYTGPMIYHPVIGAPLEQTLTRAEVQAMIDAAIREHDATKCVDGTIVELANQPPRRCIEGSWYSYSMNGRTLKPFPRPSSATGGRP